MSDAKAQQAMETLEEEVVRSGVSIYLIHRLNSIVNAIECQVEEGKRDRTVLEPLFEAFAALVDLCPEEARSHLRKALRECRSQILE
jgi:hypothetical protein